MGNEHWVETTLGEIATHPQYGWTTKAGQSGKFKYFRTTDIDDPVQWDNVPYCVKLPDNPSDFTIRTNDILVSRAGSVGLSIRFKEDHLDTLFASYLIRFRALNPIDSKLIEYYLNTKEYWSFISESQAGIAVPNVNATKLSGLPFPLPPLPEQRRIVEKLDSILPKVKNINARLDKIPRILKRFRQSVLASACSGKLTEDWRDDSEYGIDNIPTTWATASIEKLVCSLKTDLRTGPFGTSLKKSEHQKIGVPIWGIESIGDNGAFTGINKIFVTEAKAQELKSFAVKGGDIIISRSGTVGELCLLPDNIPFGLISTNLMKISLNKNVIHPKFFCWLFDGSQIVGDKLRELCSGSTRLFLTQTILKNIDFSLPPIEEQQEIVCRVEKLFKLADSLEAKYKKAFARVEKIEQSVLAKAFRGELAAQDPNDEPAEELLKRILAEKAKLENTKKKRKSVKKHKNRV